MTVSAEQIRTWSGPAVLSVGFRPFFLSAAIWVARLLGGALPQWELWLYGLAGLLWCAGFIGLALI